MGNNSFGLEYVLMSAPTLIDVTVGSLIYKVAQMHGRVGGSRLGRELWAPFEPLPTPQPPFQRQRVPQLAQIPSSTSQYTPEP